MLNKPARATSAPVHLLAMPMPTPHTVTFAHALTPLAVGRVLHGALHWAAGAALCMAFFASPAMAQAPSTYQGYLDECLAQAKRSQESLRRGIEKRTAEGDAAKAEALTQRLAEHLANSAQKCETFSRQIADNDAKIAKMREDEGKQEIERESNNQKIREGNAKIKENIAKVDEIYARIQEIEKKVEGKAHGNLEVAANYRNMSEMRSQISALYLQRVGIYEQIGQVSENYQKEVKGAIEKSRSEAAENAKIAGMDARIAELLKINEGFQKFNAELPQLTRDLEAVLAGKITGGQRDAVIRKLEAFVVTGHDLIKRTRAMPSLQTPENVGLLESFERSVQKIESSLRSTTRK